MTKFGFFPGELAKKSMEYVCEQAPEADAIVVNGMPNFRRSDELPQRMVSLEKELEDHISKPIVSSDSALYWRIFKTLEVTPIGENASLLSTLS